MAKVTYIGQYDAVLIPLPHGGDTEVTRGDVLSTTDEHAASLCEQSANWELLVPKSTAKAEDTTGAAPVTDNTKDTD